MHKILKTILLGFAAAGLCLTAFLQTTMLTAGLMVWNTNMLLGCGMMLASTEVPRIAGAFGISDFAASDACTGCGSKGSNPARPTATASCSGESS